MKIGILYPRSGVHSNMMVDFMDGIKTALHHTELTNHIQLSTESVGFGGLEKEIYDKAEKLLVLEDVDILVAYIDTRVMGLLQPLVYSSGKLMIVVNPGANYPHNWIPQPGILYLGLQHGFLCWLSGQLAGWQKNAKAGMATSFYDCGYLHGAAMVKSFVKAGGSISLNYINNRNNNKDPFDITPLNDLLTANEDTHNLLCIFDSVPAFQFYHALNELDASRELQLFVSPMMLEETALAGIGEGFHFSIDGYLPWYPSLKNKANGEFTLAYHEQTKRKTGIFSLLGWETGLIIREIFTHCEGDYRDAAKIVSALVTKTIDSPRGDLKLDEQTNYFVSPVYKYSIAKKSAIINTERIDTPAKEWKDFTNEPTEGAISGWTNTYLCY